MDLRERIRRRQHSGDDARVVREYEAISPVAHVEEPTDRGPTLEQLLDYLDPAFEGRLPTDAYVWGPAGAGKSAVVTALFSHCSRLLTGSAPVIHTSTRAQTVTAPAFVYVDARRASSSAGLYHAVLDALVEESVPRQGVGTDELRSRLIDQLGPPARGAVVAVDHLGEPGGLAPETLTETVAPVEESIATVAIGDDPPDDLDWDLPPARIEVPAYQTHALVDILTVRASAGLAQGAIDHEQVRRLADWAAGNAGDALAALFAAAVRADEDGAGRIRERDLTHGMNVVPSPAVPLGRVLTLPDNRQLVLRRLVELDEAATGSVDAAVDAVSDAPDVDLSAATVRRFLYELAEDGIVDRVAATETEGAGRPPSRLEPRFPTPVFCRLYDLAHE